MLRAMCVLVFLSGVGLAQSSPDGSFSVHNFRNASYSLKPAQIREAEKIYNNVRALVQREFHRGTCVHPHFTVVIGAEDNEVHSRRTRDGGEIWMKEWDPAVFVQGVVILAFDEMLTHDVIVQLSNRALRQSNATVDIADWSKP
jgi:hypothetical protein